LPDSRPKNIKKPLWTKNPIIIAHLATFLLKKAALNTLPMNHIDEIK
jgi:hypothetical protein